MRIHLLWVGKTQQEWVRAGIDEYASRVKRYVPLQIGEVKDEKGTLPEMMRQHECERLERRVPKGARLILLDERGEQLSSEGFAALISKLRDTGTNDLVFAIGGAYGFADSFRKRGEKIVALSRMTFTHQMVRIVLLEQLYRAFTIIQGEPYHHRD